MALDGSFIETAGLVESAMNPFCAIQVWVYSVGFSSEDQ